MGKKLVHIEIPAKDADRAQRFWEGVGGWSIGDSGMPGWTTACSRTDDWGGAVYPQMEGDGGPIDLLRQRRHRRATSRRCASSAARRGDKEPIPHVGWFARCKDTEGNSFSLFQSDESVTMPEGAPGA